MFKRLVDKPTLEVARGLLGCYLVRTLPNGKDLVGRIVETEGYLADDPACHAYAQRGRLAKGLSPTGRSAVMFAAPATAYVYLNYGLHWLFNIVTEKEGVAGAVLIRALEPISGVAQMKVARDTLKYSNLTNGPGKLTQAMQITGDFNGHDVFAAPLCLEKPAAPCRFSVVTRTRVGISKAVDKPWRFYVKDSQFVSKL